MAAIAIAAIGERLELAAGSFMTHPLEPRARLGASAQPEPGGQASVNVRPTIIGRFGVLVSLAPRFPSNELQRQSLDAPMTNANRAANVLVGDR